jgi:putative ABC transport system substrate-binding protein
MLILAGAALTVPYSSPAQRRTVPRIGYLSVGTGRTNEAFLSALKDGLRELGYVDGRDIVIDVRWVGNRAYTFPDIAATLVEERPNALVTTCIPSTRAAKQATSTIPIVMSVDGDPVSAGLVASLARPGANVTGTATLFEQLISKWLELILATVPASREIAVLRNPENLVDTYFWAKFVEAAKERGTRIVPFEARLPEDLIGAFAAMRTRGADALIVMTEAFLAGQVQIILPLAAQQRLPAIYGYREFTEAGGLMSYGLSYRDYYRGVARYVDAVLKGAKPADLPVEQPTKIELVINMKTAQTLGIAVPPALLARADRVLS